MCVCVFDLWICVHLYVGDTHLCMKVKDEGQCQVSSIVLQLISLFIHLLDFRWDTSLYLNLRICSINLTDCQGKEAPCLSLFARSWLLTCATLPRQKLNALCFHGKYFTNRSISPDPLSSFLVVYVRLWKMVFSLIFTMYSDH